MSNVSSTTPDPTTILSGLLPDQGRRDKLAITLFSLCGLVAGLICLVLCMLCAMTSLRRRLIRYRQQSRLGNRRLSRGSRNVNDTSRSSVNLAMEIQQLMHKRNGFPSDELQSIHSANSRHNLLTTSMPNLGVKVMEAKATMRAAGHKSIGEDRQKVLSEEKIPLVTTVGERNEMTDCSDRGEPLSAMQKAWRSSILNAVEEVSMDSDEGAHNIYENPRLLGMTSHRMMSAGSVSLDLIANHHRVKSGESQKDNGGSSDDGSSDRKEMLTKSPHASWNVGGLMKSFNVPQAMGQRMKKKGPQVARKPRRKPIHTVPPFIPDKAMLPSRTEETELRYKVLSYPVTMPNVQ